MAIYKYVLTLFIFFMYSGLLYGQKYDSLGNYGVKWARGAFDKQFNVPFIDTSVVSSAMRRPGAIVCRPADSMLYMYNGRGWGSFSESTAFTLQQVLENDDTATLPIVLIDTAYLEVKMGGTKSGLIRLDGGINTDIWFKNNMGADYSMGVGGNGTPLQSRFFIYDVDDDLAPFVIDGFGDVHMGGYADATPIISVRTTGGFASRAIIAGRLMLTSTTVRNNLSDSTLVMRAGDTVCIAPPIQPLLDAKQPLLSATNGSVLFSGGSSTISQDNSNFFWDDTNNRLGIGLTSPSYKLHISGSGSDIGAVVTNTTNSNMAPIFRGQKSVNGGPVVNGSGLVQLSGDGMRNDGQFSGGSKALIQFSATETWSPTANGTQVSLYTTANTTNTITERMTIKNSGIVNISTVPEYADNAAALAGGLVAGDIYRTVDNLKIVH